jgi:ABC-type nitrate/sulfonate/bicarbonate transport system substrate-binding protein
MGRSGRHEPGGGPGRDAAIECTMRYGSAVTEQPRRHGVTDSVTVGSFSPSVVLDVARRTGRLDRHRLRVTETPVTSSPAQFQALLDGELDMALTSPDNVIAYRFSARNPLGRTLDAGIVAAVDRGLGLGLYARPGLGVEELRGKRVAVDVPVSGFALALYALLEDRGVGRDEVELVVLGSTPRRARALVAGECDATMLNAGNELLAEQAGCPRLLSVPEVVGPYLGTVVATIGTAHLQAARRLADALRETASEILSGRLDDEVRTAASERLGVDEQLAGRYLDRLRDPVHGLVPDGVVGAAELRTLVALRQRYLPVSDDRGGDVLDHALDRASGLLWSDRA